MKLFLLKLPVIFGFIVAACSTQNSPEPDSVSSFEAAADVSSSEPSVEQGLSPDRKVIREGDLYFKCRDIQETDTFLKTEVKTVKGYVSNESSSSYGERTEKRLTVRIPADQLDALLAKIEDHAVAVENVSIRSEDVTEQFIDVQARLKTKKELENRYTELLKQARTLEETLGLERELANVRGEIESMQGRLNYLGDRVAMSSLNVSFYVEKAQAFGFLHKASEGIGNGWKNLQWFLVFLINIWPFFLIFGALLFWLLKRKKTPPPPLK